MQREITVSINCITFNQEDYIADALESFLMQKTNFKYEILIHDDASSDGTGGIIQAYEKKYPDIVKPIYQTKNQYSRGVEVGFNNIKRAKGRYIAMCEGDDFWTDPYKLQKQADYMTRHPECSLCVHAARIVNPETKERIGNVRPCQNNRVFAVEEIIKAGGGLFATSSMMFVKEVGEKRPDFYHKTAPVGDYPLMIFLALKGTVFYIDEFMSAYRLAAKGSWTSREFSTIDIKTKHFNRTAAMLDGVNEYTNFKYNQVICSKKRRDQMYLSMCYYCPGFLEIARKSKRKYNLWALK